MDPTPDQLVAKNPLHVQEWFANVLVRTQLYLILNDRIFTNTQFVSFLGQHNVTLKDIGKFFASYPQMDQIDELYDSIFEYWCGLSIPNANEFKKDSAIQTVSLLDPVTLNCIQFPARTMHCTHFSVCEAASLI